MPRRRPGQSPSAFLDPEGPFGFLGPAGARALARHAHGGLGCGCPRRCRDDNWRRRKRRRNQRSAERVCLHQAERAFFRSRMAGSGAGDGQNPGLCSDKGAGGGLQNRRREIQSRICGRRWSRAEFIWEIPGKGIDNETSSCGNPDRPGSLPAVLQTILLSSSDGRCWDSHRQQRMGNVFRMERERDSLCYFPARGQRHPSRPGTQQKKHHFRRCCNLLQLCCT